MSAPESAERRVRRTRAKRHALMRLARKRPSEFRSYYREELIREGLA
jgi:hypothetical protein